MPTTRWSRPLVPAAGPAGPVAGRGVYSAQPSQSMAAGPAEAVVLLPWQLVLLAAALLPQPLVLALLLLAAVVAAVVVLLSVLVLALLVLVPPHLRTLLE